MKIKQVLAKVYEPERLHAAWQRVKANAGAAGIDQMSVKDFVRRENELLTRIHDKLVSCQKRCHAKKGVTH